MDGRPIGGDWFEAKYDPVPLVGMCAPLHGCQGNTNVSLLCQESLRQLSPWHHLALWPKLLMHREPLESCRVFCLPTS